MIHECINLKTIYPQLHGGDSVLLTSYCLDNFEEWNLHEKRKTILILPGGGYQFVSQREAEPIALQYLKENINAFVLSYTVTSTPHLHPLNPIDEVFAAIVYIKKHAEKYHVDVDHISVLGFSAGGHLAASTALFMKDETYSKLLKCKVEDLKFKGVLLGYPVITLGERTHGGTALYRAGDDQELIEKLSVEKHITKDYPPTFIWTTFEDQAVSPFNSLMLVQELIQHNVRVEFHLFPEGMHGLALTNDMTSCPQNPEESEIIHTWVEHSVMFIKKFL